MDQNRLKNAANWFYEKIFTDEPIKPRTNLPAPKVPSLLRTARSLEMDLITHGNPGSLCL